MRNLACIIGIAALLAAPALAATVTYSWEDGGTILGSYGNLVDPTNVSGPQVGESGTEPDFTCPGANSGNSYLHVAEAPHASTPQAYIAFIENLAEGDVIDASFFGYDISASSPSMRIWAHYALNGDVNAYEGSAGGNDTYTSGIGWEEVGYQWVMPADKEALVIELRLYSTPSTADERTDYFVDDLTVTAPDCATITVAPEPASLLLLGLAGLLIRRR